MALRSQKGSISLPARLGRRQHQDTPDIKKSYSLRDTGWGAAVVLIFVENVDFPIKCRLSVHALGRPTRLNPTVPRLRLQFLIFIKPIIALFYVFLMFLLACPVAAGFVFRSSAFLLGHDCVFVATTPFF